MKHIVIFQSYVNVITGGYINLKPGISTTDILQMVCKWYNYLITISTCYINDIRPFIPWKIREIGSLNRRKCLVQGLDFSVFFFWNLPDFIELPSIS